MALNQELPIPYDVLVAHTEVCLAGYSPGFVEFAKEKETPGSTTYKLWQDELGELGIVRVAKLRDRLSEVIFNDPPRPTDNEGLLFYVERLLEPVEKREAIGRQLKKSIEGGYSVLADAIRFLEDVEVTLENSGDRLEFRWPSGMSKSAKWETRNLADQKIKEGRDTLYRKRKEHKELVRQAYFDRLIRQNIWPEDTGEKLEKPNWPVTQPPGSNNPIVAEQRKRREFLYFIYRHSWVKVNHAAPLLLIAQECERNWGVINNEMMAPILDYLLAEGFIADKIPEPSEYSLIAPSSWPSAYITHMGIKAVESDIELQHCLVHDGAVVDWSRADDSVRYIVSGETEIVENQNMANIYELGIKTDIAAFENELKRFARDYRQARVLRVEIGEWRNNKGAAIDEVREGIYIVPVDRGEGRGWPITIFHQSELNEWQSIRDTACTFWVSRLGDGWMRLRISPCSDTGLPFVRSFIVHAKGIWETKPFGWNVQTESPMPINTSIEERKAERLPPITDPIDQLILEMVTDDPDLADKQIGARLAGRMPNRPQGLSRQAVNVRRRKLEDMGYRVR